MAHPRRSFIGLMLFKANGMALAIFFVVGLVLMGFAVSASLRAMRLETRGATVTGTVNEMKITSRRCGERKERTCYTYTVTYDYRLPDGRGKQLAEQVSKDFYDQLMPNADVLVHYLPDDLSVAEIEWGATRETSWVLNLVAGALVLGGGLLVVTRAMRVRQLIWLANYGTAVTVAVDQHEATWRLRSRKNDLCATWFNQVGGKGWTDPRHRLDLPQPGALIHVLADPRGKFAPVWEEDLL